MKDHQFVKYTGALTRLLQTGQINDKTTLDALEIDVVNVLMRFVSDRKQYLRHLDNRGTLHQKEIAKIMRRGDQPVRTAMHNLEKYGVISISRDFKAPNRINAAMYIYLNPALIRYGDIIYASHHALFSRFQWNIEPDYKIIADTNEELALQRATIALSRATMALGGATMALDRAIESVDSEQQDAPKAASLIRDNIIRDNIIRDTIIRDTTNIENDNGDIDKDETHKNIPDIDHSNVTSLQDRFSKPVNSFSIDIDERKTVEYRENTDGSVGSHSSNALNDDSSTVDIAPCGANSDDDAQFMSSPEEREFDLFAPKKPIVEAPTFPDSFVEQLGSLAYVMFTPISSILVQHKGTKAYWTPNTSGKWEVQ